MNYVSYFSYHRPILSRTMMMEKLVEWWVAGETEVLGETPPQCRFVHHKPHVPARTRIRAAAVGSQQRLTAWVTARPSKGITVTTVTGTLSAVSELCSLSVCPPTHWLAATCVQVERCEVP
jgi:hypothetical protein